MNKNKIPVLISHYTSIIPFNNIYLRLVYFPEVFQHKIECVLRILKNTLLKFDICIHNKSENILC